MRVVKHAHAHKPEGGSVDWHYSGHRLGFPKPPIPATHSWWTSCTDFYATAKAEAERMNRWSGVEVVAYLRRQMGEEQ